MEKKIQEILSELDCEMYQKDTDIFLKSVINYICENYPEKQIAEELRYNTDLMIIDLENREEKYLAKDFLKDKLGYTLTRINNLLFI